MRDRVSQAPWDTRTIHSSTELVCRRSFQVVAYFSLRKLRPCLPGPCVSQAARRLFPREGGARRGT